MALWHVWTDGLAHLMSALASQFGLSQACAIILLTLGVRLALMPLSLTTAVRARRKHRAMEALQPELDTLKQRLHDRPQELAAATLQLYKKHGISLFDRLTLLSAGAQAGIGLGVLQALRGARLTSPFLWIADIGRPNFLLTVLVGLLMGVAMALAPEASTQASMVPMIVVSCLVTMFALASMSSSVGVYWATSNLFSIGQSLALRALVRRDAARRL